ncbi:hypothetical protein PIB30_056471 [Stylosanthes scabra]|uniref:Uncharacterized protein n=1 Tax=Stylosanthes scabra TaxID=79078 RepID=A0ABU6YIN3_9FABA|nr:hypothetical protein [Stylosanthes scabra]
MSWGITIRDLLPLLGCIEAYAGQLVGRLYSRPDHLAYFNFGYFGDSRLFNLTGLMTLDSHLHPSMWGRYLPPSDEKALRVLQMRHRLDMLRESDFVWVPCSALDVVGVVDPVDWMLLQFGGVQSQPPKALELDFLHSKDGRGGDRWLPTDYPTWHRE